MKPSRPPARFCPIAIRTRAAALAFAFSLGGCWWVGPPLYPPDPGASAPVRPGRYVSRSTDRAQGEERVTVTRDLDGAWRFVGGGANPETIRAVFASLAPTIWIIEALPDAGKQPEAIYGIAWRRGQTITVQLMDCKGAEAVIVHAGGAIRGAPDDPECVFTDRGSLERAVRAWLVAHPNPDGTTLTRVGE